MDSVDLMWMEPPQGYRLARVVSASAQGRK
jgi:hypothetical protein